MKQEKNNQRLYYFDYDVFHNIDTAEKAYWLGFLYADGYIMSQKGGFGIALNRKDRDHLVKFCNFLNINTLNCIKENNNTNSVRISLFDVNLYNDLVKIGFNSQKSYDENTLVFDNIPDIYKKFFLLGFWDGDGYVSIVGEGKNQTGCVSNNFVLIEAFIAFINQNLGNNFTKLLYNKKTDPYPRIRIYTNKAKQFLDWLYKDAPVFLTRKHDIYLSFKEPDLKYNRPYKNIRRLPSGNYFVQKVYKGQKYTIGTYSTIQEAVEAYNEKAKEIGFKEQKYIGEFLKWEEI